MEISCTIMFEEIVDGEVASTSNSNVISEEINDPTGSPTESIRMSKSSTKSSLQGWSKTEKLQLYKALQNHGSSDTGRIICELPSKSPKEIRQAIKYYKKQTSKDIVLVSQEQDTKKPEKRYSVPLSSWANELTDNIDINELHNEIALVIRFYADFGNLPLPNLTDNVIFRNLYLLLADAMDGKPLTGCSKAEIEIIRDCILNASVVSSEFMKNTYFDSVYENIQVSNDFNGPVFAQPTSDEELSCLRHLITQKRFNPLNMSEFDLKRNLDPTKKIHK